MVSLLDRATINNSLRHPPSNQYLVVTHMCVCLLNWMRTSISPLWTHIQRECSVLLTCQRSLMGLSGLVDSHVLWVDRYEWSMTRESWLLKTRISCHWRTRATRCIAANVLQTKVDAQWDNLRWQRFDGRRFRVIAVIRELFAECRQF